jgi:DtxR family Mn-dependent transcriptional regulator
MSEAILKSEPVQNYLKAIYTVTYGAEGALPVDIAAQVGVTQSGVSKMLRQLARHELVTYEPYRPVHLTPLGMKIAIEIIRHHRLLELYLSETLGYGWEQVHSEAERLEHHISEEFEERIDRALGYPKYDPHGDPIPSRDGEMPPRVTATLESQETGAKVVIRRVTDEHRELLCYLAEHGLRPGTEVTIVAREPFGGSLVLSIGGREERISPGAACDVFVEPCEARAETG